MSAIIIDGCDNDIIVTLSYRTFTSSIFFKYWFLAFFIKFSCYTSFSRLLIGIYVCCTWDLGLTVNLFRHGHLLGINKSPFKNKAFLIEHNHKPHDNYITLECRECVGVHIVLVTIHKGQSAQLALSFC